MPGKAKLDPINTALDLAYNTRPVTEALESIVNFRDVGQSLKDRSSHRSLPSSYIKIGRFFRSGRLDDATTGDLEILTKKYSIETIIDLRSEIEGEKSEGVQRAFPSSSVSALTASDFAAPNRNNLESSFKGSRKDLIWTKEEGNRNTFYINFAGTSFRFNSIWRRAPFALKTKIAGWITVGQKVRAVRAVGETVLASRGLIGLNQDFLDFCGKAIVQAIRLIAEPDYKPVLLHCSPGKDRTGLVVALTLALCSIPEDLIVADYVKSQEGLEPQRDVMVKEMARQGLDSSFCDAPAEVIRGVLEYVREKYNGVDAYMERLGFTQADKDKLRKSLLAEGL
ncbi:hypothetical protein BZG36_04235 [Bifiguratus adelaidae]|uniref:Tyrosine specific protein phosphatases domain-containing protein n=1 Tax=Bifiguratus adelaidae TaxID=1938954 RepID=A0A261Y0W7_9FUNG|nr:hypothetical protein BZG36_04235 [Bifiguratus adelaidae]